MGETIDSFNLTIYTCYTDAWATYLNDTAKRAGLEKGIDYEITYPDPGCVCLSFLPAGNNNYSIYVNETLLYAELGRRGGGVLPGGTLPGGSGNVM